MDSDKLLKKIYKISSVDKGQSDRSKGLSVFLKNINTGETLKYATMTEAGNAMGVSLAAIRKCLASGKLLQGTYEITQQVEVFVSHPENFTEVKVDQEDILATNRVSYAGGNKVPGFSEKH